MANIEGVYGASNYESGRAIVDLRKKIYMLNPGATPFLTFSQALEGDPCTNMEFDWLSGS